MSHHPHGQSPVVTSLANPHRSTRNRPSTQDTSHSGSLNLNGANGAVAGGVQLPGLNQLPGLQPGALTPQSTARSQGSGRGGVSGGAPLPVGGGISMPNRMEVLPHEEIGPMPGSQRKNLVRRNQKSNELGGGSGGGDFPVRSRPQQNTTGGGSVMPVGLPARPTARSNSTQRERQQQQQQETPVPQQQQQQQHQIAPRVISPQGRRGSGDSDSDSFTSSSSTFTSSSDGSIRYDRQEFDDVAPEQLARELRRSGAGSAAAANRQKVDFDQLNEHQEEEIIDDDDDEGMAPLPHAAQHSNNNSARQHQHHHQHQQQQMISSSRSNRSERDQYPAHNSSSPAVAPIHTPPQRVAEVDRQEQRRDQQQPPQQRMNLPPIGARNSPPNSNNDESPSREQQQQQQYHLPRTLSNASNNDSFATTATTTSGPTSQAAFNNSISSPPKDLPPLPPVISAAAVSSGRKTSPPSSESQAPFPPDTTSTTTTATAALKSPSLKHVRVASSPTTTTASSPPVASKKSRRDSSDSGDTPQPQQPVRLSVGQLDQERTKSEDSTCQSPQQGGKTPHQRQQQHQRQHSSSSSVLQQTGNNNNNNNNNSASLSNTANSATMAATTTSSSVTAPAPSYLRLRPRRVHLGRRELIGKGSFGNVYKGIDMDTNRLLAVKEIVLVADDSSSSSSSRGGPESQLEKIQKEIHVMMRLEHPNIVRCFGEMWDEESKCLRIFMEFVSGGTLSSLIRSFGPVTERQASRFVKHILKGLRYLHSQRFAHRDLKGDNLLVDSDGVLKLADFGTAKELLHTSEKMNTVTGTAFFMAPEVIKATGHGTEADIWSVGCCVFEMLQGKPPLADQFQNHYAAMVHVASFKEETLPLPPMPGVSDECKDFLAQCLRNDPDARPTCQQLLEHPWVRSLPPLFDRTVDQSIIRPGGIVVHELPRPDPIVLASGMGGVKDQPPQQQRHDIVMVGRSVSSVASTPVSSASQQQQSRKLQSTHSPSSTSSQPQRRHARGSSSDTDDDDDDANTDRGLRDARTPDESEDLLTPPRGGAGAGAGGGGNDFLTDRLPSGDFCCVSENTATGGADGSSTSPFNSHKPTVGDGGRPHHLALEDSESCVEEQQQQQQLVEDDLDNTLNVKQTQHEHQEEAEQQEQQQEEEEGVTARPNQSIPHRRTTPPPGICTTADSSDSDDLPLSLRQQHKEAHSLSSKHAEDDDGGEEGGLVPPPLLDGSLSGSSPVVLVRASSLSLGRHDDDVVGPAAAGGAASGSPMNHPLQGGEPQVPVDSARRRTEDMVRRNFGDDCDSVNPMQSFSRDN